MDFFVKCESLGIDCIERVLVSKFVFDEVDDEDIIWEVGDVEVDKVLDDIVSILYVVIIEKGEVLFDLL